ncbi:hypothetical protein SAMN05428939_5129 [Streptomyces sp. TLI_105]|nr:hypothetical protein SAMN05428939_5129 [Streptomyces sp. TLI_105]
MESKSLPKGRLDRSAILRDAAALSPEASLPLIESVAEDHGRRTRTT